MKFNITKTLFYTFGEWSGKFKSSTFYENRMKDENENWILLGLLLLWPITYNLTQYYN